MHNEALKAPVHFINASEMLLKLNQLEICVTTSSTKSRMLSKLQVAIFPCRKKLARVIFNFSVHEEDISLVFFYEADVFPQFTTKLCISNFTTEAIVFPQFITKLLHFPSSRRSCCISPVYDKAVVFQVHDDAVVFPQFMTKLVFPQFITKLMFPKFATKLLYFPSLLRSYQISSVSDETLSPVHNKVIEFPQFMTRLFPQLMSKLLDFPSL